MLNILCRRIKQIRPSFTFKAIKMTSGLKFFMSLPDKIIIIGEQGMVQRWELLPPTSVAWVQIPVSTPYVVWVCFGSLLCSERFSAGTPLLKNQFSNSNSTRNQVDEEPLCGCATSKSFFFKINFMRKVKSIKQNKTFILNLGF